MRKISTIRRILFGIGLCGLFGCFLDGGSSVEGGPTVVTFPPPPNPITLPNGSSHIVFVSTRDGNRELYIMNSDGTQQTRLTYSDSDERAPSISPDGKLIAFTSNIDGDEEIWVMASNGTNIRQVTNGADRDFRGVFHPNSRRLTFTGVRTGDGEIYAMNLDGSALDRVTNDPTIDTDSVWDPSGQFIAYSSGSNATGQLTGALGLYTINVATKQKRAIAVADSANQQGQIQHIRSANWSPNGQRIAFEAALGPVGNAAGVGPADLYTIGSTGQAGSLTRLTDAPSNEDDPSYSPDNTRLVFRSNNGGNSDIYTASATAPSGPAQWIRLTTSPAEDSDPWWGVAVAPEGCTGQTQSATLTSIATRSSTVRQNSDNTSSNFPGFIEAGDHDEGGHKTVQGFFGFALNGVPNDPNRICTATLVLTENRSPAGTVGQPFTQLGTLWVERIATNQYGSLNLTAPVTNDNKVARPLTLQGGANYGADVTSMVIEMVRAGQTEAAFRMRFTTPENNDGGNDIADFFITGTSQPRLVITYSQ